MARGTKTERAGWRGHLTMTRQRGGSQNVAQQATKRNCRACLRKLRKFECHWFVQPRSNLPSKQPTLPPLYAARGTVSLTSSRSVYAVVISRQLTDFSFQTQFLEPKFGYFSNI